MNIKLKYTKFQVIAEVVSVVLLIATYAFLILRWNSIPELIPAHYNGAGEINRWGNKSELIVLPMIGTVLYAFLTVIQQIPAIWNVPVHVDSKNSEKVYGCLKSMLIILNAEMLGTFCYLTYNGIEVQPLSEYFTLIFLTGLFVTILFFMIRVIVVSRGSR